MFCNAYLVIDSGSAEDKVLACKYLCVKSYGGSGFNLTNRYGNKGYLL